MVLQCATDTSSVFDFHALARCARSENAERRLASDFVDTCLGGCRCVLFAPSCSRHVHVSDLACADQHWVHHLLFFAAHPACSRSEEVEEPCLTIPPHRTPAGSLAGIVRRETSHATRRNIGHHRPPDNVMLGGVRRYPSCVPCGGRFVDTKVLSHSGQGHPAVRPRLASRRPFASPTGFMVRNLTINEMLLA